MRSFCIDNEKLLEKYETIWTKIVDLKNIGLNALPVNDERYIKTKIKTYYDKIYTKFRGLNEPEYDIEYKSFTVTSIDSLLEYENEYYRQLYLDNRAYEISNKKLTDYLDDIFFLKIRYYKHIDISKGIHLSKSNKSKEQLISPYWFF